MLERSFAMVVCASALFFTLYFRFANLRYFRTALRILTGRERRAVKKGSAERGRPASEAEAALTSGRVPGEISHLQALTTALSGTVGIGNIANVAVALTVGGPGATFWMIASGFLGMSTKMAECTAGLCYRQVHADGSVSAGPMHYLSGGLAHRGLPTLGWVLGSVYAAGIVLASFGSGNMFQANQAFRQFVVVTGGAQSPFADHAWLFGLLMAVAVLSVTLGGVKSIAAACARLVPSMVGLYLAMAGIVLIVYAPALPATLAAIIDGAFSPRGVAGGALGVMSIGIQRAVFSNEAGLGSASIAHGAVRTARPASEGIVALLEPFLDTIVICTTTALVILVTHQAGRALPPGMHGIELTSAAFAEVIPFAPWLVAFAGLLFATSTTISWSYYGLKGFTFLFGDRRLSRWCFTVAYGMAVVVGASITLKSVVAFSDAMLVLISLPNLLGLFILAPGVRRELDAYPAEVCSERDVEADWGGPGLAFGRSATKPGDSAVVDEPLP